MHAESYNKYLLHNVVVSEIVLFCKQNKKDKGARLQLFASQGFQCLFHSPHGVLFLLSLTVLVHYRSEQGT